MKNHVRIKLERDSGRTGVMLAGVLMLLGLCFPGGALAGQQQSQAIDQLTSSNLPSFLKTFSSDVAEVNAAFEHLSKNGAAMFDSKGQALGRRRIKDREQTVIDLKGTLKDFKRQPGNLVVTMTLSAQTEELADEIYDLTQMAYDNDQEETALNLTRLLGHFNDDAGLLQAYALELASQKEQRLTRLESGHR